MFFLAVAAATAEPKILWGNFSLKLVLHWSALLWKHFLLSYFCISKLLSLVYVELIVYTPGSWGHVSSFLGMGSLDSWEGVRGHLADPRAFSSACWGSPFLIITHLVTPVKCWKVVLKKNYQVCGRIKLYGPYFTRVSKISYIPLSFSVNKIEPCWPAVFAYNAD